MTSYKDAGVDIEQGNIASKGAYSHAQATFDARSEMIGSAVLDEGGFAGMLDMGNYYLVQNDDGTGSKMELACALKKYDTLGYDLLAMVVDDAICTGAEVMSVSNTLDVPRVDPDVIDQLMVGLSNACQEQKIIIPGGEIAEVPGATTSPVWNATSVGVLEKEKALRPNTITPGDVVISLQSGVARSNGFSLIRKVLSDHLGNNWVHKEWSGGVSWGEIMLSPSIVYHGALLSVLGRYGEERIIDVKGIAHITGGGLAENLQRVLKTSGFGATLNDLWEPHQAIKDLIELGSINITEAYKTWNMGNGMLAIVNPEDAEEMITLLENQGLAAKICGSVTEAQNVQITTYTEVQL